MVRLKGYGQPNFEHYYSSFQFHYGTIKRPEWITLLMCIVNFNSTMVRLKVQILELVICLSIFQFHYGTIKSPL